MSFACCIFRCVIVSFVRDDAKGETRNLFFRDEVCDNTRESRKANFDDKIDELIDGENEIKIWNKNKIKCQEMKNDKFNTVATLDPISISSL